MSEIACPICHERVVIGLPRDASVESITDSPVEDGNPETGTRFCKVSCSADHDIHVKFSVTVPNEPVGNIHNYTS